MYQLRERSEAYSLVRTRLLIVKTTTHFKPCGGFSVSYRLRAANNSGSRKLEISIPFIGVRISFESNQYIQLSLCTSHEMLNGTDKEYRRDAS